MVFCHHQTFGDKLPTDLVQLSCKSCVVRCRLLQFWEIFTLRSPGDVQVQSWLGAFFGCVMRIQRESFPWSFVAQGLVNSTSLGLFSKSEEHLFWRCLFQ